MIKKQSNYGNVRASLNLFDDKDGLLRLKGRFANSKLTYEQQYPVLLRGDSHFTKLIIWDAHEATMHHGVESTLARIRSRYWIIKGRKSVKNVLRKCVVCKRYQGRPLQKLIAFEIAEGVGERKCDTEVEINDENETVGRGDSVETETENYRRPTRKAAIDGENARRLRNLYYS